MLLINNQAVEQILDMKGCIEALETGYRDLDQRAGQLSRPLRFLRAQRRSQTDVPLGHHGRRFADLRDLGDPHEVRHARMAGRQDRGKILRRARHLLRRRHGFFHPQRRAAGDHQRRHHPAYARRRLRRPGREVSLPRRRRASSAFFGSGGMARTYLLAFNEVRKIREVRSTARPRRIAKLMRPRWAKNSVLKIIPVENPEDAVRGCGHRRNLHRFDPGHRQ